MTTIKQTLVEYANVILKNKGTSNTSNLQKMFPSSPMYTNDISDLDLKMSKFPRCAG